MGRKGLPVNDALEQDVRTSQAFQYLENSKAEQWPGREGANAQVFSIFVVHQSLLVVVCIFFLWV